MSGKQGPARVRVFSSDAAPAHPMRRRTDLQPDAGGTEAATSAPLPTTAARSASTLSKGLLVLIFLVGCIAGGALLGYAGAFQVTP